MNPEVLNRLYRDLVDPSSTTVLTHTFPRLPQDVTPVDTVIQSVETPTLRLLGSSPQPILELSHFHRTLTLAGVIGPGGPGHALTLTPITDTPEARALPSRHVLMHGDPRYYDPDGLPLRSG
jgi:hypothetical protein